MEYKEYDDYEHKLGEAEERGDFFPEPSTEQRLQLIFKYVGDISNEKNLDKLLMLLANMGKELVVADRCTVWLVDYKKGELWTKVAHGVSEIRVPMGQGVVGHSINNKEVLVINDAYNSPLFNPEVDKKTGYHTRNIIVIPFRNSEDQIIGAYQAINKMTENEIFSEKDVEYLVLAAAYSGNALESAILYREIEDTQKEIIYTMAEVGESRSKETGFHVKRVAEYSRIIAESYGLSKVESELLKMASPMHDIGKIAIPDAILKKPAKLTDEEYEVMKQHAVLGYDMLKHSDRKILKAAATVAHEHHEKWNGKGYPRGLQGEDIHIFGRITALADVFDALGSDRCYKKAWPLEKIYSLFMEEKGQHFDPKVIDAFFNATVEINEVREKYQDVISDEE